MYIKPKERRNKMYNLKNKRRKQTKKILRLNEIKRNIKKKTIIKSKIYEK